MDAADLSAALLEARPSRGDADAVMAELQPIFAQHGYQLELVGSLTKGEFGKDIDFLLKPGAPDTTIETQMKVFYDEIAPVLEEMRWTVYNSPSDRPDGSWFVTAVSPADHVVDIFMTGPFGYDSVAESDLIQRASTADEADQRTAQGKAQAQAERERPVSEAAITHRLRVISGQYVRESEPEEDDVDAGEFLKQKLFPSGILSALGFKQLETNEDVWFKVFPPAKDSSYHPDRDRMIWVEPYEHTQPGENLFNVEGNMANTTNTEWLELSVMRRVPLPGLEEAIRKIAKIIQSSEAYQKFIAAGGQAGGQNRVIRTEAEAEARELVLVTESEEDIDAPSGDLTSYFKPQPLEEIAAKIRTIPHYIDAGPTDEGTWRAYFTNAKEGLDCCWWVCLDLLDHESVRFAWLLAYPSTCSGGTADRDFPPAEVTPQIKTDFDKWLIEFKRSFPELLVHVEWITSHSLPESEEDDIDHAAFAKSTITPAAALARRGFRQSKNRPEAWIKHIYRKKQRPCIIIALLVPERPGKYLVVGAVKNSPPTENWKEVVARVSEPVRLAEVTREVEILLRGQKYPVHESNDTGDDIDPKEFLSGMEAPEKVLKDLGFVGVGPWSWIDAKKQHVVDVRQLPNGWRITSFLVGLGREKSATKEFASYALRAGLEWAYPPFSKWWRLNLPESADEESEIDPKDYALGTLSMSTIAANAGYHEFNVGNRPTGLWKKAVPLGNNNGQLLIIVYRGAINKALHTCIVMFEYTKDKQHINDRFSNRLHTTVLAEYLAKAEKWAAESENIYEFVRILKMFVSSDAATIWRNALLRKFQESEEPTDAQKEAGNYKMRHLVTCGFDISIETEKNGTRSGTSPSGVKWEVKMPCAYGYLKGTEGKDGDHVDVYVNEPVDETAPVFVLDQKDADTGKFDEHKCFLFFKDEDSVKAVYDKAFDDGKAKDRIGAITKLSIDEFKTWLEDGDTTKKLDGQEIDVEESVDPDDVDADSYLTDAVPRCRHCGVSFLAPNSVQQMYGPENEEDPTIAYLHGHFDYQGEFIHDNPEEPVPEGMVNLGVISCASCGVQRYAESYNDVNPKDYLIEAREVEAGDVDDPKQYARAVFNLEHFLTEHGFDLEDESGRYRKFVKYYQLPQPYAITPTLKANFLVVQILLDRNHSKFNAVIVGCGSQRQLYGALTLREYNLAKKHRSGRADMDMTARRFVNGIDNAIGEINWPRNSSVIALQGAVAAKLGKFIEQVNFNESLDDIDDPEIYVKDYERILVPFTTQEDCKIISDRWGDVNDPDNQANVQLVGRYVDLMGQREDSFIVIRNGAPGILYEWEYLNPDSDDKADVVDAWGKDITYEEAKKRLLVRATRMQGKYPKLQVYVTQGEHVFNNRFAIRAFDPEPTAHREALPEP